MARSLPLLLSAVVTFVVFASLSSFTAWSPGNIWSFASKRNQIPLKSTDGLTTQKQCKSPRINVWADLKEEEANDLLDFLYKHKALNLTRIENATVWDNHVAIIEVLPPNKTDVLQYLDEKDFATPPRYARVIVNQGSTPQAAIHEYMVGPLPTDEQTTVVPLTFPYNSGRNYVNNPLPWYEDIVQWFADLGNEVSDVVEDLLGDAMNPGHLKNAPPFMTMARPAAFNDGVVSNWATVHSPGLRFDSWSMLPQGLYCRFEIRGRSSKDWTLHEWYYNGVLYNSTEAFRKAWKAHEIKKVPINRDGDWSAAEPKDHGLPERDIPAPVMIAPAGQRWHVDTDEKYVKWMGFEFFINSLQATGLGLWDIRFKGDRIIYQVGLQEAIAHYAGNDPVSVGQVWLDSLFGMGFNMYELVQGYDCPSYATYMPVTFTQGDTRITRNNAICIFEYTADHPIQRHTTPTHVTISRNTYLIVRSVSTVGNYDYTIDYIFYLDGAMEVKVRASGYIFGAYNYLEAARTEMNAQDDEKIQYEYGYQIHDVVASSMHDHVLNFKADFDILGTKNTFYKVSVEPYHHTYPWEVTTKERSTMRLRHEAVASETALDWPANSAKMYLVLNNETKNEWGEKRGYRIAPGTGMGTPPHLTMLNSTALGKSADWAYHDLFVLRQHDTERKSCSEYNGMDPQDPLVSFAKMVDDEAIEHEDLVVYFNLGSHHVPHSGDVPNTLMHTSGSSVMFIPHNFHSFDPSRLSAQGVKISMTTPGNGSEVKYIGGTYSSDVVVHKETIEPDLTNYQAPEHSMSLLAWNETLNAL